MLFEKEGLCQRGQHFLGHVAGVSATTDIGLGDDQLVAHEGLMQAGSEFEIAKRQALAGIIAIPLPGGHGRQALPLGVDSAGPVESTHLRACVTRRCDAEV